MAKAVILVSPAPVDGYPPVQYQARMLARSGVDVILLTTTLNSSSTEVRFSEPGVITKVVRPLSQSRVSNVRRIPEFALSLARARSSLRRSLIAEIAYDPEGVLVSDLAPFRPAKRMAHLHETVSGNSFAERRLSSALRSYSLVVVPDAGRASLLHKQLGLSVTPTVVPNFPMLKDGAPTPAGSLGSFEVIYGGSISRQQMIDVIIRSVPLWPKGARFVLLGDTSRPTAQEMRRLTARLGLGDRVFFEGWTDVTDLIERYSRANLGVSLLTSDLEQWRLSLGASNKRYQYMQAGLPQIGDMNPGVPELIEGNQIGRCVRGDSEREIADIVSWYMNHPVGAAAEGKKAALLHQTVYNYDRVFAETRDWLLRA